MRTLTPEEIKRQYMIEGKSLREIAEQEGVSHQAISARLKKLGVRRQDGRRWQESAARQRALSEAAALRMDARCRKIWGISHAERMAIRDKYGHAPFGYYSDHRFNAKRRGIAFNLTFAQWWSLWDESGRWRERGLCKYVMARNGDTGPYEVGNVRIVHHSENMAEFWNSDLGEAERNRRAA